MHSEHIPGEIKDKVGCAACGIAVKHRSVCVVFWGPYPGTILVIQPYFVYSKHILEELGDIRGMIKIEQGGLGALPEKIVRN